MSILNKFFFALLSAIPLLLCAQTVGYREIPTREGVKLPFLYIKATNADASVILFQGGNGVIGAAGSETNGWAKRDTGFLSGGMSRFASQGFSVALVDKPSDRGDLNRGFRSTPEHAADVKAMIGWIRKENPKLPVWLVGTSNGSLSAALAASMFGKDDGPNGIVLTASVSVLHSITGARFTHPFTQANLHEITVPVLFVHHKFDGCDYSPFASITELTKEFKRSPRVNLIPIEGGSSSTGRRVCESGHHQFVGIEDAVTKTIADWIKSN